MAGERILVVDDEATILTQLEDALGAMGYNVVDKALSAQQAIDAAHEHQPDIVLMDIVMPGELDGIQACTAIQADLDIPVVLISAHGDDETLSRVKAVRPSAYLLKPHRSSQIKACIEMVLERKEMERKTAHSFNEEHQRLQQRHNRLDSANGLVQDSISLLLSMLHLQSTHSDEPGLEGPLEDIVNRVWSIFRLQDSLYGRTKDTRCDAYLHTLTDAVRQTHFIPENIRLLILGGDFTLPVAMLQPLGLIVSELMVNAARHAFPHGQGGNIGVVLRQRGQAITIALRDDGAGFPMAPLFRKAETTGLDMVHRLVKRMNGLMEQHEAQGTAYTIVLPLPA